MPASIKAKCPARLTVAVVVCNTVMPLKCDSARKIVDDSGFPRTPDRLLKFCGTHVWLLEVFKIMTSICGTYNLGGSATPVPTWGAAG
jgi:hypothetical protein